MGMAWARSSNEGTHRLATSGGGRVCSLHFRPRRWFGCRLDRIVTEFLETTEPQLFGVALSVADLLRGVVRNREDDRVLVSAHHNPALGEALVAVTVVFRLPTEDKAHLDAIVAWLGRANKTSSYYRLGTAAGAFPVRATLRVQTTRTKSEHGESEMVTTFTVKARVVPSPERLRKVDEEVPSELADRVL